MNCTSIMYRLLAPYSNIVPAPAPPRLAVPVARSEASNCAPSAFTVHTPALDDPKYTKAKTKTKPKNAGSYPGMLAGWARLKCPHLFHAAVSSSAPLRAQLDFTHYTETIRDSLASESDGVGGSEECAVAVETGARGHATRDVHGPRRAGREITAGRSWLVCVPPLEAMRILGKPDWGSPVNPGRRGVGRMN